MTRLLLLWFLINLDFLAFVSWRGGYLRSGLERSQLNPELEHNRRSTETSEPCE